MDSCIKIEQLETERLVLEPVAAHHADELYAPFCEGKLYTFIQREIPPSREWLRQTLEKVAKRKSSNGECLYLNWVAKGKWSGKPISYLETSIEKREVFLAYTTFLPFWGQGYTREGIRMVMDYIQQNYEVNKFIIEMDTRNRASTKLAEALGFTYVRTKDSAAYFKGSYSHEFHFEYFINGGAV